MGLNCWTSSKLDTRFNLWAAPEPKASNQGFNVVNGDTESFQNLWPKIAHLLGAQFPKINLKGRRLVLVKHNATRGHRIATLMRIWK